MKKTVIKILHELFEVPLDVQDDADLREYVQDSIDVGEFASEINQQLHIRLEVIDFQKITTLAEVIELLETKLAKQKHDS